MGTLKQTDVGALVAQMNAEYQLDGRCSKADKPRMTKMVKHLRDYTAEVQKAAELEDLTEETNVPQWALDMAHWRERLAGYESALGAAPAGSGPTSCEQIYPTVVGPLLDGRYDGALSTAGIVNPAVPSPPDVATPYMLGNQVLVYGEFQDGRWEAFMRYFIEEAKKLPAKIARIVAPASRGLLKVGVVVAIGGIGVWLFTKKKKGLWGS